MQVFKRKPPLTPICYQLCKIIVVQGDDIPPLIACRVTTAAYDIRLVAKAAVAQETDLASLGSESPGELVELWIAQL